MPPIVYADNAATTQLDPAAFEAMKPYILEEYGNPSQPYTLARRPKRAIREARETIAACIGADPEEIFFTSGGTESDNWAVKSTALSAPQNGAILTSAIEHHAVLHACAAVERLGVPVVYAPPDHTGVLTVETLRRCMPETPKLVSIMFANNEIGTIQPIRELCALAHHYGALFHTDAVQAVGHVPIRVHELDVDLLSASAHKFHGPRGVGFLYIKKGTALLPYADGGAQESGLRAGTENTAGIVGMAAALQHCCASMQENTNHILSLENRLMSNLAASTVPYRRNGGAHTLPGLISLSLPDADGEALLHRLDLMGICVSTGSACNGKSTDISHVLQAIGLDEQYAKGTIRISFGIANTLNDVDTLYRAIIHILYPPPPVHDVFSEAVPPRIQPPGLP